MFGVTRAQWSSQIGTRNNQTVTKDSSHVLKCTHQENGLILVATLWSNSSARCHAVSYKNLLVGLGRWVFPQFVLRWVWRFDHLTVTLTKLSSNIIKVVEFVAYWVSINAWSHWGSTKFKQTNHKQGTSTTSRKVHNLQMRHSQEKLYEKWIYEISYIWIA